MKTPIVILTDFGTSDPFVGVMKGVILNINPKATILDLTQDIPPGDILHAAVTLWSAVPYFPTGTIFLVVVDPGVGTSRRAVYVKTPKYAFIGPDNGLFSYVIGTDSQAWELRNPAYMLLQPGKTFHGRDIFAPAAAFASLGIQGTEFGPQVHSLTRIPDPVLELQTPTKITGEVLYPDRFGNLLTSIGAFHQSQEGVYQFDPWIGEKEGFTASLEKAVIHLANRQALPWASTFAKISPDTCAFIVGSSGLVEIAANQQRAAEKLKLKSGDRIILEFPEQAQRRA